MTNEDWFYFDEDEWIYRLKDNAPQKAIDSYKEFYKDFEGMETAGE